MAPESRLLTAAERAAVLKDLGEYRVLLAASRRELVKYAECACSACRRGREVTKLLYGGLARDVQAEIETRIAGIRALEVDLELPPPEFGKPVTQ